MTIEFYCGECNSLLRTADETVGKGARCPNCGNIEEVPEKSASVPTARPVESGQPFDLFASGQSGKESSAFPPAKPKGGNPYARPVEDSSRYVPPATTSLADAKARLMAPAIILIVVNTLSLGLYALTVVSGIVQVAQFGMAPEDLVMFIVLGSLLLLQAISIFGAAMMLRMKAYRLCVVSTITSMIGGACCLLPIGFAVWALVVLVDAEVKSHFS